MTNISTITWEDPNIELDVLDEIFQFGYIKNPNVLMLASAGDTAISLLNDTRVKEIVCVSDNTSELACLEVKREILYTIDDPQERLNFLYGNIPDFEMIEYFDQIKRYLRSKAYWETNIDDLVNGISNLDYWANLFADLRNIIQDEIDAGMVNELSEFDMVKNAFKNAFSNKKLWKRKSNDMIYQGLNIPLWRTMHQIFLDHYQNPDRDENLFFQHICRGIYAQGRFPHYLLQTKVDLDQRLIMIRNNIWDYLKQTKQIFSMISLGNITDSLDEKSLVNMIKLISERTHKNGRVIFRRMQSDIKLFPIVNKYFIILDIDRDYIDNTFFYKEIIVGYPR